MKHRLQELGHDVLHTLDLPLQNKTPDSSIEHISASEERIVITKDVDFVISFLIHGQPYKLLLVSTGNIANADLENLFLQHFAVIVQAFDKFDFIEIDCEKLTYHR